MMVSNNHTIMLQIHEERQNLLENALAWPVGSHMYTPCPWNITFIDKRCCCSYGTALEKHGLLDNTCTAHHDDTLHTVLRLKSPLYRKLPKYPVSEISWKLNACALQCVPGVLPGCPPKWNAWVRGYNKMCSIHCHIYGELHTCTFISVE